MCHVDKLSATCRGFEIGLVDVVGKDAADGNILGRRSTGDGHEDK